MIRFPIRHREAGRLAEELRDRAARLDFASDPHGAARMRRLALAADAYAARGRGAR